MGKKLLILTFYVIATFLTTEVFGQAIYFVEGTSDSVFLATAGVDTYTIDRKLHIYHDANYEMTIMWDANGFGGSNSNWDYNLCEGDSAGACFPLSLTPAETFKIAPGDTSYVKVQFLPNGEAGNGTIPLEIWEDGNQASSKSYVFYMQIDSIIDNTSSINEIANLNYKLYPNPAVDMVNIDLPYNHNVETVKVYNVLGKEVYQTLVNNNTNVKIETKNYKSGVYIIKLIDNNNNINTSTFIVK